MENINLQKEWNFVQFEVHKEKPTKKNKIKRELLFLLQLLLPNIKVDKDISNYFRVKEFYNNS